MTVGGGSSGTLVNRFWVLTADHCVSSDSTINGPNAMLTALPITAAWSPLVRTPTRVVRNWAGSGLDVALVFLGAGDFGPVNVQLYFVGDLEAGMTVTKYGRGRFALASAGPPPVAAPPSNGYRSARFTVSAADARRYTLPANGAGQSGAGGDSGGPDIVTAPNGIGVGISGVSSTCAVERVPGQPTTWDWVTNISRCTSASISSIRTDILEITREGTDPCRQLSSSCSISAVQRHVDGLVWRWDGRSACTATACPGWTPIDQNPRTQDMVGYGPIRTN